jgi:acyl-CoA thioester hydrolase
VDYHSPLVADGSTVRVEISVRDLRAASFTLDYTVYNGRRNSDAVVATAETLLVPYDVNLGRPRRLTDAERDFLAGYRAGARSA